MRISQLARKYNISITELTSFLQGLTPPLKSTHPNAKVEEDAIQKVVDHFDLIEQDELPPEIVDENNASNEAETSPKEAEETKPEEVEEDVKIEFTSKVIPDTPEEDIALAEGEIAEIALDANNNIEKEQPQPEAEEENDPVTEQDEVILSDQLIEMLDSEDTPAELEKIKLIKAPKKKLSGLKVVDKIEVPEDSRKNKKKEEIKEPSVKYTPEERAERARKREEYKEKRRLEAKKKQEAHKARTEKRKKEEEVKRLKAIKEKHYKQQLSKAENQPSKKRSKKQLVQDKEKQIIETAPKPKTVLGKFWRWLNT